MSSGLGVSVKSLRVFSRRGEPIVRDASFSVGEGELAIVFGRSGSGKTTILRCLAGVAQGVFGLRVEGSVSIRGSTLSREVLKEFVSYVPQEPWSAIASPYPITELLSFTPATKRDVESVARELGIEGILYENTSCLSPGEIQRLLIAEAWLGRKRVLLVDEALSYLDERSRSVVAKLVRDLVEEGATAIVVDHVLDTWRGSYTKAILVEGGVAKEVSDDVVEEYAREFKGVVKQLESLRPRGSSEIVLEARDTWFRYPDSREFVIEGLSLEVFRGEVLVIRGASGRGKTTLLKVLAGIYRASRGFVKARAKPQLVPENPLLYISSPTPREELGGDEGLARVAGLANRLDTPIAFLSGGERRRLAIASAYRRSPELLLLDEPSVGLDPWSALSVAKLVSHLARSGSAVVIATHDPYLRFLGTRVVEL